MTEAQIQADIIRYLEARGWFVKPVPSTAKSAGWPDLYCFHIMHNERWVEIKKPNMEGSRFTRYQIREFARMVRAGVGIWILTAATDSEYKKLFRPQNYSSYLMRKNV